VVLPRDRLTKTPKIAFGHSEAFSGTVQVLSTDSIRKYGEELVGFLGFEGLAQVELVGD
jgi:hypothetical protein